MLTGLSSHTQVHPSLASRIRRSKTDVDRLVFAHPGAQGRTSTGHQAQLQGLPVGCNRRNRLAGDDWTRDHRFSGFGACEHTQTQIAIGSRFRHLKPIGTHEVPRRAADRGVIKRGRGHRIGTADAGECAVGTAGTIHHVAFDGIR